MKTIYLVKKNPEVQGDQNNWITMNSYEFAMFMKTEEGKRRRPFFGEMEAVDENDYKIVMECDLGGARELKQEKRRRQYIRKTESESGFKLITINELKDDRDRSLEETELIDENVNVEEESINAFMLSKLRGVWDKLDSEERQFIHALYLSENCVPGTQYAKQKKISYRSVTYKKKKIFEKIKDLMDNE